MARYHIETYGCTSNRGESRQIESALRDAGHYRVEGPEQADVAIMNTCTVVEKTERNMVRRAERTAIGDGRPHHHRLYGAGAGRRVPNRGRGAQIMHWDDVPTAVTNGECPTPGPGVEPVLDGVVGILPIARGCMSDCSYCITKHATGKIDSPSVEENVEKARALVHAGAKELRITGQDTGVYGWDQGERKLHVLLDRICNEIEGDFRVRVGMANPKGVHGIREELAQVFAETTNCTTSSTRRSSPGRTTCSATCAASIRSMSTSKSSRRSTSTSTTGRSRRTSSSASPPKPTKTTNRAWRSSVKRAPRN